MKTNAKIIIHRNNKEITIYIKDGNWDKVPNVEYIADVEIHELSDPPVREYECPTMKTIRSERSGKTIYEAYVENMEKNNDFLRPYGPLGF